VFNIILRGGLSLIFGLFLGFYRRDGIWEGWTGKALH